MTVVHKSFHKNIKTIDPVIDYCSRLTVKQDELQAELQEYTLNNVERGMMLGAPEVLTIGSNFIKLIDGKRALDIGTFTGASALAWALTVPADGEVYTLDIDHSNYKKHGIPIIGKAPEVLKKINPSEGPALESLDKLISEEQTFDFAFIDADKESYPGYYEKCVQLLRPGGVIIIDNALRGGKVANYAQEDTMVKAIDETNRIIFADSRTASFLVNCGDGIHVAFKL